MKKSGFLFALAIGLISVSCRQTGKNDSREMDSFINNLMSEMTLEEKLGQLNLLTYDGDITTGPSNNANLAAEISAARVGAVINARGYDDISKLQHLAVDSTRLGIPLMFGLDVIHGYQTVFPIPLAQSCSWDMAAIEHAAGIAAKEAAADGIDWTYSPMVDISRDPRWGRVAEGAGEDPYLGSHIAAAMVQGYQGSNLSSPSSVMSCVKHFACYGASEGGRDYNTVDMSRVRMYNEYLPPYKAAVEAGAGSFMTSFNVVDFVPATANKWLITDLLRGEWGFKGFVVTDYTAISEMIAHGMGDLEECSARALSAGVDMDMISEGYINTLEKSLDEGKVSIEQIDVAVRRVLEAKYSLGLFNNPYLRISPTRADSVTFTDADRTFARNFTAETFVLLKNKDNVLPLKTGQRIAVIGQLAKARRQLQGTWCVAADHKDYTSIFEAVSAQAKGMVSYAPGCRISNNPRVTPLLEGKGINAEVPLTQDDDTLLAEALRIAKNSDVILLAIGEVAEFSGESNSLTDISMPATQKRLVKELSKLGKQIILLNFSGRPNVLTDVEPHVDAIMNVWFGGSEMADALCDVLFGKVSPSGKLTMSMPRSIGQIPLYYNMLPTGRPISDTIPSETYQMYRSNYIDEKNSPLYPFGYGLSYTTFDYSGFSLSHEKLTNDNPIIASVTVSNSGKFEGSEVVQFYISDSEASLSRPIKELKYFERITLKPGESRTVRVEIVPETLAFYNSDLDFVTESGEFRVMVGPDSNNVTGLRFEYVK